MRFFSTLSTQQNKTPGRACYSTRCFVVCPNSIPIKNGVFGLYSNGGADVSLVEPLRCSTGDTFGGGDASLIEHLGLNASEVY